MADQPRSPLLRIVFERTALLITKFCRNVFQRARHRVSVSGHKRGMGSSSGITWRGKNRLIIYMSGANDERTRNSDWEFTRALFDKISLVKRNLEEILPGKERIVTEMRSHFWLIRSSFSRINNFFFSVCVCVWNLGKCDGTRENLEHRIDDALLKARGACGVVAVSRADSSPSCNSLWTIPKLPSSPLGPTSPVASDRA